MIAKIHPGNNFGGLVNYANDIEKKDAVVVASDGVSLASNAAITASFKVQAKTHSGVKDFVGHISLSFSPEDKDKVDNELMAKIAQEYMRRMGIINTQYVIFRHQDQPHPHVHIVYNRVDNDGNIIKGDCSFSKSAAITKALKDCITWQQLRKALSEKGISLDFVRNSDGSVRGVTFTDNEYQATFSGSKIDRSLSFGKIDKNMVNIYQINDDPSDRPEFYPHYDTEYITHITQQYGQYGQNGQDRQSTPSDDIEDAFNFTQASGQEGGTSSGSGIGSAIAEVLLQPHVVPSSGGGGGSSSKDDDDDDKEKNKNKYYTPRKRKR